MSERRATRRRYLLGFGAVGAAALAGCIDENGTSTAEDDGTDNEEPAVTPASGTRPDFGGYLDGARNYDGTVVDATGQADVRVTVGAGGSNLAFSPVAVHVDSGATVVWEWTGKGGAHNVVAEDESFNSGEVDVTGTYRYTFEADGIYNYYCVPHKGSGMLGAIVVGTDYPKKAANTGTSDVPASSYLYGVNGYDGYVDAREFASVTVEVGAEDGLAFGPPAIHVDPGTEVSWAWTGEGGAHNVIAEDGTFDSGEVRSGHRSTFTHQFSESGVTRYYCLPHRSAGMKGTVVVGGDALPSYAGTYDPSDYRGERSGGGDHPRPDLGGYLEDARNYDGTVVNRMGTADVTVDVGAGDGLSFGPPVVHVDLGATVHWEWTGAGGAHNVVAEDGTFDSGSVVSTAGATYYYTFDRAGIYKYYCTPHKGVGMKGAVVVGTDYPSE